MAEGVVAPLIDKLISLLSGEATLLQNIHEEVADIKDELESIQSFLKDADARAAAEEDISEGVKTWVTSKRSSFPNRYFHGRVLASRGSTSSSSSASWI